MDKARFAHLLTEIIKKISAKTGNNIRLTQDKLGYACGKKGGSYIEYLRKDNAPKSVEELATLIREIQKLQACTTGELKELLVAGGHPDPNKLLYPIRIDGPPVDVIKNFSGREGEIEKLHNVLKPGRVMVRWGPAGVGKTALVGKVIKQLAPSHTPPQQFPDGILYYPFSEQEHTAENAFQYIADFFGVEVTKELSPRDAAIKALRNKQALIVLDSAEEADDLRKVIQIRQMCGVLIVSRYEHFDLATETPIFLDKLIPDEAVTALRAWSTDNENLSDFQVWSENTYEDNDTARDICRELDGLPLALRLAGQHMLHRQVTPTQFLALWHEWKLALLHKGKGQHDSLQMLMERSLEQVCQTYGENAREVVAVTGILAAQPFNAEVISAALEKSKSVVIKVLQDLWKFSLIRRVAPERWQVVHRLVYTYAQRIGSTEEATARLAVYYTTLPEELNKFGPEGYKRLNAEREHIMAVLLGCVMCQRWTEVQRLGRAIRNYLVIQMSTTGRETLWQACLTAAKTLQDRYDESTFLNLLALVYTDKGEWEKAFEHHQKALTLREQLGDLRAQTWVYKDLGYIYLRKGEWEKAIKVLEQAQQTFKQLGDLHGQGSTIDNLGMVYAHKGELDKASEFYQQSLQMQEQVSETHSLANAYYNLGHIYLQKGEWEKAIKVLEQAQQTFKQLDNLHDVIWTLFLIGLTYAAMGQYQQAMTYHQQILTIAPGDTIVDVVGELFGVLSG